MSDDIRKNISSKYCPRFGQIAVEMKLVTEEQLMEAFCCQFEEELCGQEHRLLGNILLAKGWITSDQIENVLNVQLKRMRQEDADYQLKSDSARN